MTPEKVPVRPSAYMIAPDTSVPFRSKNTSDVSKSLPVVHHLPFMFSTAGDPAFAFGGVVGVDERGGFGVGLRTVAGFVTFLSAALSEVFPPAGP